MRDKRDAGSIDFHKRHISNIDLGSQENVCMIYAPDHEDIDEEDPNYNYDQPEEGNSRGQDTFIINSYRDNYMEYINNTSDQSYDEYNNSGVQRHLLRLRSERSEEAKSRYRSEDDNDLIRYDTNDYFDDNDPRRNLETNSDDMNRSPTFREPLRESQNFDQVITIS